MFLKFFCRLHDQILVVRDAGEFGVQANNAIVPHGKAHFIAVIEEACGKAAIKRHLPMQPGDVRATYADVSDLMARVDFRPDTPIETGIARFVAWYREFDGVSEPTP